MKISNYDFLSVFKQIPIMLFVCSILLVCRGFSAEEKGFQSLFPENGIPKGWVVRAWSDLAKPGSEGAQWVVENKILNGGGARGSWLISEREKVTLISTSNPMPNTPRSQPR